MKKNLFYGRHHIDEQDIDAVVGVLKSDFLTTGPLVKEFEEALAKRMDAKYAVVVSNGTAALHLAYAALDLTVKDEVLVPALTFAATANAALYCGAKPVFVDIDKQGLIDIEKVESLITSKTKIIVPVHYSGIPVDMKRLSEIANKHNVSIVEDACHALGSKMYDQPIGNCAYSDMAVFSFHPVKAIATGEGGAILTNSKKLYQRLLSLRTHGFIYSEDLFENKSDGPWYHEMQQLGFNYRLSAISCALGISQLRRLDNFIHRRRTLKKRYDEAFSSIPELTLTQELPWQKSACHLYVIRTPDQASRKALYTYLKAKGINCQVHYIPVYKHPYYAHLDYKENLCPRAEAFYNTSLSIPFYVDLTDEEQEEVITAITGFFSSTK